MIVALKPSDGDKNPMFTFFARTEIEARAANLAVENAMVEAKLLPFHQVGRGNEAGYHGWEMWRKDDEDVLLTLLPQIDEGIHAKYTQMREFYPEKDYPEMYAPQEFSEFEERLIQEHDQKAIEQRASLATPAPEIDLEK